MAAELQKNVSGPGRHGSNTQGGGGCGGGALVQYEHCEQTVRGASARQALPPSCFCASLSNLAFRFFALADIDEDDDEDDEPALRDQKLTQHVGETLHLQRDPTQTQHGSLQTLGKGIC